jgi:hypothetical protein
LSVKTRKVKNRAATALRMAALSLHRSQSFLGHFYRRMRSKLGAPKAITATAHKLARIIYHMVTTGHAYDETICVQNEMQNRQRGSQAPKTSPRARITGCCPITQRSSSEESTKFLRRRSADSTLPHLGPTGSSWELQSRERCFQVIARVIRVAAVAR